MRILRVADVPDVRTGGMQRGMYGTGDVLRAQGQEKAREERPHGLRPPSAPDSHACIPAA